MEQEPLTGLLIRTVVAATVAVEAPELCRELTITQSPTLSALAVVFPSWENEVEPV